ncbi:MAG TPA: cupredoxin domain-containing protein [Nitrososphaerales archaeon]|nr:cupredoxin domain-containing protein [Nitrososphaerales archaeon]
MSKPSSNTAVAGVVISVIVIAAVASIGYYQFNFAKTADTNTSLSSQPVCNPSSCVKVNITSGASGGPQDAPGYSPENITVVIGVNNTVQWTNQDAAGHSVTGKGNAIIGSQAPMDQGDTYVLEFTAPGTYDYGCIYHAWMHGSVTVLAGNSTSKG